MTSAACMSWSGGTWQGRQMVETPVDEAFWQAVMPGAFCVEARVGEEGPIEEAVLRKPRRMHGDRSKEGRKGRESWQGSKINYMSSLIIRNYLVRTLHSIGSHEGEVAVHQ
jgi:hypothetical protein